jgi:small subunit ribosomal protein S6
LRTYEVVHIAAPNTSDDDLNKLNTQLEQVVADLGGTVTKTDVWGRRKLAYPIEKYDEGIYTVFYIDGTGKEIAEVERRLRVTDLVIRFMTVRTDEDLKRAAKLKAKRKVNPDKPAPSGDYDDDADEADDEGFDS